MTKDVETFRCRANALRLQAALAKQGIPSRVRSQGDGAVWTVFTRETDATLAQMISIAVIYI